MKHSIAFAAGLALAANADAAIMFSQTGVALIGAGATSLVKNTTRAKKHTAPPPARDRAARSTSV